MLRRMLMTGDAVGGVWRYSLELARGLSRLGVETTLAVLGPAPGTGQMSEASAIPGLHVISTCLPLDWTAADEVEFRETGAALAGMAVRLRADTVHLHTPALAAEVAWPVPVVAVAHSDVGTWWKAIRGGTLPEDLAWRAATVGRGLAEAAVAIAPSRSFARALNWQYRPGRPIEVVPNGREYVPTPPCPRRRAVLTCGRLWDEGKNFSLLDRAAEQLDAPVLAAGAVEGPNGAVADLTRLTLLGRLDTGALALQMAATTVFVAPSRYEPFGLAVLEAAQAGMALALADIDTFRELWDGAALFFHPDDSDALTNVLRRLLARPEEFAGRARQHAARYAPEPMVRRTLAFHHSALGKGIH